MAVQAFSCRAEGRRALFFLAQMLLRGKAAGLPFGRLNAYGLQQIK